MTEADSSPDSVHFVGRIAFDCVAGVICVCGITPGGCLGRRPDGEPGGRRLCLFHKEGVDAARRRVAAAQKFTQTFGVATERGIARQHRPASLKAPIRIQSQVSPTPA